MVERPTAANPADLRRLEVHQATGMLAVQLAASVDVALHRLIEHATRTNRQVVDVARDIISHRLVLDRWASE